ncbi:MAG: CHAT domain-containing protein [Anaerolineaceae bacterium]|nr:CHAT domain-containing protein [Anaerolineaceae bacterium]
MPNSFAQTSESTCSRCGQTFQIEIWQIIDTNERPDLLSKLEQESIHFFSCPQCQNEMPVDAPLLIYRLGDWPKIIFSPTAKASKEQKLQQANELLGMLRKSLPDTWNNEWLKNIATVPRPVLAVFLKEGPESAAARLQKLQNVTRQPAGIKIPPGFEGDGRQIMELTQQAQRDPSVLPQLMSALEFTLMRLTPEQYPVYWAALHNDLGNTYAALRSGDRNENLGNAVEHFRQALRFRTHGTAPLDFAATQNNLGNTYKNLAASRKRVEDLQNAIKCYQQALTVYNAAATPFQYAATQNNLGNAFKNLAASVDRGENLQNAIDCYLQALTVYTPASAPIQYAATQNNLAAIYYILLSGEKAQNLLKAIESYHRALIIFTPEVDPIQFAATQNNLGLAYAALPDGERVQNLRKAIDCYQQALRFRTRQSAAQDFADTQINLGAAYTALPSGDRAEHLRKAIEYYEQALTVYTSDNAAPIYAATQSSLGAAYFALTSGDRAENLRKTIECYQQALVIYTPEDNLLQYAAAQTNLGAAYAALPNGDRLENLGKAFECFQQALRFRTPEATPLEYAATQHELGSAFYSLPSGDRLHNLYKAMDCYQEALRFRTPEAAPLDYAATQNNLGAVYSALPTVDRADNLRNAIECYQQALRFRAREIVPQDFAMTQKNLGNAYYELPTVDRADSLGKAIEYYQQALTVYTSRSAPLDYASTQNSLGNAYSALPSGDRAENLRKAIECYQQALRFRTPEAAPLDCRRSAQSLGDLFLEQKKWREAYAAYHLAFLATERLFRYAFRPDSRQIAIQSNEVLYRNMVTTCLRLSNDPGCRRDGLVTAEAGKARVFLDQMGQSDYPVPAGVPETLIEEENQLLAQLRVLEIAAHEANLSAEKRAQYAGQRKMLQEQLEVFWKQLVEEYPHALDYVDMRRGQSPSWKNLVELSSRLGPETALVEFYMLEDEIAAFVLCAGQPAPQVFSLPISRQRMFDTFLNPYIDEILNRNPNRRYEHVWQGLGEELLAPLREALKDARLVYFIPHGWLHLLPLHALTVGGQPFILQKAAAYAPSAAMLLRAMGRRINLSQIYSALVVGYTTSNETVEREALLGEAGDIAAYFKASPHLDDEASLVLLEKPLEEAGLVHFSCHGSLNGSDPLASSLQLAGDDITVREWMSHRLQAELVTLSACQTSFSNINSGNDISGLSRALLYAGAKSNLLTLWWVNGQTTRQWMTSFYQKAWNQNGQPLLSKAMAFQKAVLELREQQPDPYYWAPFILIGDAS